MEKMLTNFVDQLLNLGRTSAPITVLGNQKNPFAVIPNDFKIEDLEKFLDVPTRKRGTFQFHDTASFIAYVNLHKGADTAIYATLKDSGQLQIPTFAAVIDEYSKDTTAWRGHKATYECRLSPEWKIWMDKNKKPGGQVDFAQFIEDNTPDIVRPEAAEMLEIAKSLEAKKAVSYKSGIKLENGDTQFQYTEETVGKAGGNGTLEIPSEFVIAIPIVVNGPKIEMKARLRYRITEGVLQFWYDLERPHKIVEAAFKATWEQIEKETTIQVLHGQQ